MAQDSPQSELARPLSVPALLADGQPGGSRCCGGGAVPPAATLLPEAPSCSKLIASSASKAPSPAPTGHTTTSPANESAAAKPSLSLPARAVALYLPHPPPAEYAGEPDDDPTPGPGPTLPSNLDSLETSVRGDFDRFWSDKGTPADYFAPATIDESSLSSNFRHSGWKPIRKRVWESMDRVKVNASRKARFGCCGSYSWVERSTADPDRFRVRHNHCNDRLCTPCALNRSMALRCNVLDIIGTRSVSFITLTLCGAGESLAVLLDRLYKHFRALRVHPTWADNVKGGVAFLEVKWNDKAQRWHPHFHILCDAKFIPKDELRRAWFSISKDSFIVDIQRVDSQLQCGNYVTKYASKPLNTSFSNTPSLLDEAVIALKGRRLCFAFGTWYGKALTDPDLDGDDALDQIQAGWAFFAELEELLQRANSGNPDAVQIFKSMNAEAAWRATLTLSPP